MFVSLTRAMLQFTEAKQQAPIEPCIAPTRACMHSYANVHTRTLTHPLIFYPCIFAFLTPTLYNSSPLPFSTHMDTHSPTYIRTYTRPHKAKKKAKHSLTLLSLPPSPFFLLFNHSSIRSVAFKTYIIATYLGILPGIVAYVYMGSLAEDIAAAFASDSNFSYLSYGLLSILSIYISISPHSTTYPHTHTHPPTHIHDTVCYSPHISILTYSLTHTTHIHTHTHSLSLSLSFFLSLDCRSLYLP